MPTQPPTRHPSARSTPPWACLLGLILLFVTTPARADFDYYDCYSNYNNGGNFASYQAPPTVGVTQSQTLHWKKMDGATDDAQGDPLYLCPPESKTGSPVIITLTYTFANSGTTTFGKDVNVCAIMACTRKSGTTASGSIQMQYRLNSTGSWQPLSSLVSQPSTAEYADAPNIDASTYTIPGSDTANSLQVQFIIDGGVPGWLAQLHSIRVWTPAPGGYRPNVRDLFMVSGAPKSPTQAQLLAEIGLAHAREDMSWADIQPDAKRYSPPDNWDWTAWDDIVKFGRNHGYDVLPILENCPTWARQTVNCHSNVSKEVPVPVSHPGTCVQFIPFGCQIDQKFSDNSIDQRPA